MELVIATKNKKKLEEIRYMLKGLGLKLTSLADYKNPPQIIEDGSIFRDNAVKKAVTVAKHLKKLTLGEDSGLEVKVLDNQPGVFSARYSGEYATDKKNNKKILKELGKIPLRLRKARYVCSVAISDGKKVLFKGEGYCSGFITFKERGSAGFGYDPLFFIPKYNKTFGELGEKIKHKMSHRYKAFKKVKTFIQSFQIRHRQKAYRQLT